MKLVRLVVPLLTLVFCHALVGQSGTGNMEKQTFPVAGQSWENTLGMKFVPVPGTEVLFSIWDTRVQDFDAFVRASGHDATAGMYSLRKDGWQKRGDTWKRPGFAQEPTHPVCGVNWEDAQAFCVWLTKKEQTKGRLGLAQKYQLPTDAEWSVAAGLDEPRGGTPESKSGRIKGVYPWGTQWPPPHGAGNYGSSLNVDDFVYSSPVGSFAANKFGLYDMGGNVWQWCEDSYGGSSGQRVLRGVSFRGLDSDFLLSSRRVNVAPDYRGDSYGFRCVVAVGGASVP